MDTLIKKTYYNYDYKSRYTPFPYYYDTLSEREIYGIGANMKKGIEWVAHKVKQEDTLDNLALYYYSNPSLWWIIAYFNDIQDSFKPLIDQFEIIKIPNMSSISFETRT